MFSLLPGYYGMACTLGDVLPSSAVDLGSWQECFCTLIWGHDVPVHGLATQSTSEKKTMIWTDTRYAEVAHVGRYHGRDGFGGLMASLQRDFVGTQRRVRIGKLKVEEILPYLEYYYHRRKYGGGAVFLDLFSRHREIDYFGVNGRTTILILAWTKNLWCYYVGRMNLMPALLSILHNYTNSSPWREEAPVGLAHFQLPRLLSYFMLDSAFRPERLSSGRDRRHSWVYQQIYGSEYDNIWLPATRRDRVLAWPTYIDGTLFWILRTSARWYLYAAHPLMPQYVRPIAFILHPFHKPPLGLDRLEKQHGHKLRSIIFKGLKLDEQQVEVFQKAYEADPVGTMSMYQLQQL